MTLTEWQRRAVGTPFVPFGRDYTGWDCYGAVVVAYRAVFGVELPDFYYPSVKEYATIGRIFLNDIKPAWTPVQSRPMAVACIYRRGLPIHAGLVVENNRILHVEHGIETCIQPAADFRVEGYYEPACRTTAPV